MARLNTASARVVDPILTNHARGYMHNDRKGIALAPLVTCPKRGVKRIEFGKESFLNYETARAPGANTKRIQFGYEGKTVSLTQHALDAQVPREYMDEGADVPSVDLQMDSVNGVQDIISLDLEREHASLLTTAGNYAAGNSETLAGNDQWSDYANSDPSEPISDAKSVVRKKIGMRPNTLLFGGDVYDKLQWHPKIQERFKYTSDKSVTSEMMARFFDVQRVEVADSVYAESEEGEFIDVWGKVAILAYVAPEAGRAMRRPSFAYTYRLRNHPFVEQGYWDRDTKSWVYGVTDEWSTEIVGPEAGYLMQNAVG